MVEQHKKRLINSCVVLAGLLSLTWQRAAFSALPPAAVEAQPQEAAKTATPSDKVSVPGKKPATESIFLFPPVLIGGTIAYDIRSDANQGQKVVQQGIIGTIKAKTRTYLWQPWFAQLSGDMGLNVLQRTTGSTVTGSTSDNAFDDSATLTSKNLSVTGSMQLNVLPRTPYPFEARYSRSDSRVAGSLSALNGLTTQSLGLTQNFSTEFVSGSVGWDHGDQTGSASGDTRQDTLRLSLSKALTPNQNLQVYATRTDNRHDMTGERAVQTNVNAQHNYAPDDEIRIDTLANASQAAYALQQGRTDVNLMQVSSFGTWRPEEESFTVTGGARLLTMANSASDTLFTGTTSSSRIRNANFNVGIGYELSSNLTATASANLNMAGGMGASSATTNESVGITYLPETIQFGEYRYNWSTSASATNSSGGQEASRNLSLQLSHGLSRSLQFSPASTLTMAMSQSIASMLRTGGTPTQRLTHSGSVSWNMSFEDGVAYFSMNASDSRSLGVERDSFQMINFQASSSMPAGRFGSLSGNLTIQAVRQEAPMFLLNQQQQLNPTFAPKQGFVLTSSGSLSYMHSRVFGIPRLRFMSDVRLNSQALLPMLGGPQDMETASWDNMLDYAIGRTHMRLNSRVAQLAGRKNKSIMFTISRGLGAY